MIGTLLQYNILVHSLRIKFVWKPDDIKTTLILFVFKFKSVIILMILVRRPKLSKPVLEDLFTFSGRRNRKSYFLFTLMVLASIVVLTILAFLVGFWIVLLGLPIIVSSWAVSAQRCRDFGWTGWAVLITLIPYIGFIFSFAILFIPSNVGKNRYGDSEIGQDETQVLESE